MISGCFEYVSHWSARLVIWESETNARGQNRGSTPSLTWNAHATG
jgi:hypothetical protein